MNIYQTSQDTHMLTELLYSPLSLFKKKTYKEGLLYSPNKLLNSFKYFLISYLHGPYKPYPGSLQNTVYRCLCCAVLSSSVVSDSL